MNSMAEMIHRSAERRQADRRMDDRSRFMPFSQLALKREPKWERVSSPTPIFVVDAGYIECPITKRASDLNNAAVAGCRESGVDLDGSDLNAYWVAAIRVAELEHQRGML